MKVSSFSPGGVKMIIFLTAVAISGVVLAPTVVRPQASTDNQAKLSTPVKPSGKTRITADRLIVDGNEKYADFSGSVNLTQDDTVITASRLVIYFAGDSEAVGTAPVAKESIKRIVATGDVHIQLDDGTLFAQQAEFIAETNTYILSGEGSRLTRGKSSISGSKITFTRNDGRITVEGSGKKRVEALIFQEKEGIQ